MTPEVKSAIFNFVCDNLPSEFENKIYWHNERKDEPDKPFCLLQELIPEQKDARTSERELSGNVQEVTLYKNCVITMAVYVEGIAETADLDTQKTYAESTARTLKNNLETLDTAFEFLAEGLSVNDISGVRDLTTPISGGYNYRYEFDVTFGYNEVMLIQKEVGKDINLQIERKIND